MSKDPKTIELLDAMIMNDVMGSDHCPVGVNLKMLEAPKKARAKKLESSKEETKEGKAKPKTPKGDKTSGDEEEKKAKNKPKGKTEYTYEPVLPKRALSAYNYYTTEQSKILRDGGEGFTEAMTKAAAMWGGLTESEKEPYQKKADKDKAR